MSDERTQKIVDAVAEVARSGLATVSPEEIDSGWQRLEAALSGGKYPSVPIVVSPSRWWLRGLSFVAAALVLGFATYRLLPLRPTAPLHYTLEGAVVGQDATITVGASEPAKLVFSDASQVRIAPATKLSVVSLDAHGSRIALADGELDVRVQHRPGSSWRFDAGPFTVRVRGTAFHLGYAAESGRFALQMATGVVEVRGPSDDRVLILRAGESLELFAGSLTGGGTIAPSGATQAQEKQAERPSIEATQPSTAPAPSRAPTSLPRHRAFQPERAAAEPPGWANLIAQGDFVGVVKDAERRGIDATLASASAAELASLADAARYTKHNDLARQALLGVRARFPGTARASDAAFFLGRLAEQPSAGSGAAVAWYETYLRESARGPYAGEALGREIALLARADPARAQKAARTYLEYFPHGTQAELAKSLLQSAP
jgi:hypothetical protein